MLPRAKAASKKFVADNDFFEIFVKIPNLIEILYFN